MSAATTEAKATRTMTILGLTTIKTGHTRWGKPWELRRVEALDADGNAVEGLDLITFDDLPLDQPIEVEVEKRVKQGWNGKVWTSFAVSLPKEPKATAGDSTPSAALPGPDVVPKGYYALDVKDSKEGNDVVFVKVWRGDRNPNFVRCYMVLGPDDRGQFIDTADTLARIVEAGPREAAIRYGKLIKRCAKCGLRLTNRLSRELGIGPVCGGRYGDDDWASIKNAARSDLVARGLDPKQTLTEREWALEEKK